MWGCGSVVLPRPRRRATAGSRSEGHRDVSRPICFNSGPRRSRRATCGSQRRRSARVPSRSSGLRCRRSASLPAVSGGGFSGSASEGGPMGDHLALLVDRLLTESTLEAAIGSRTKQAEITAAVGYCCDAAAKAADRGGPPSKMVECRICQEEDWDSGMEAPCGCRGSLKYAHRKCIQRWCNEKGDTICEICLQQFRPGYTCPQQLFHYGSIPMNFRGNWEIARQDLNDSQVITMVPSERDFMDDYEDYLPVRTRSSALCCRTIAIIFMALLVLRHTLPLVVGGDGEYSFALFSLLVLRTAGILFPILVMVRAVSTYHSRRRHQIT